MEKTFLLYLLLLLLSFGCSNNVKGPKEIQPEGTFIAKDNPFYKSLTFKGKKTLVIHDAIFEMDFPSEYEKDEEFLRVKTDKSDLLFEIISEDTIKGEGFAEGLYIKR